MPCSDEVSASSLGSSPRAVYPLVVVLMLNTDVEECNETDSVSGASQIQADSQSEPSLTRCAWSHSLAFACHLQTNRCSA